MTFIKSLGSSLPVDGGLPLGVGQSDGVGKKTTRYDSVLAPTQHSARPDISSSRRLVVPGANNLHQQVLQKALIEAETKRYTLHADRGLTNNHNTHKAISLYENNEQAARLNAMDGEWVSRIDERV